MTVTIKKVGGSLAVIIPKTVAADSDLVEGTTLDITTEPDCIVMRKRGRRARRSMEQIVKQMRSSAYRRHNAELLQDPPVGKEIG